MIVSILGRAYTVKWTSDKEFTKKMFGECNTENFTITLATGMHPAREHEILIHEILHAVWDTLRLYDDRAKKRLKDSEEHVVMNLAVGISTVLLNNQALVEHLAKLKERVMTNYLEAA